VELRSPRVAEAAVAAAAMVAAPSCMFR
jgi:hypothetical protein